MAAERTRLDIALVERGLAPSRARARDAILRGAVRVNGASAGKPGLEVSAADALAMEDAAAPYVSRAALKLAAGLDAFGIDVAGRVALDIGASTGGFTQVLLERGAARVHAIDVGHGQLHPIIAGDPRVRSKEGLNARGLVAADLDGDAPGIIACDASFISLTLVLPPSLALAAPGAYGVFLVKPQFEAGRDAVGKGGILRDPGEGRRIAGRLAEWLDRQAGWRALGIADSPVTGSDGNHEFLLGGARRP